MTFPPKTLVIPHDDYHRRYVGRAASGDQTRSCSDNQTGGGTADYFVHAYASSGALWVDQKTYVIISADPDVTMRSTPS